MQMIQFECPRVKHLGLIHFQVPLPDQSNAGTEYAWTICLDIVLISPQACKRMDDWKMRTSTCYKPDSMKTRPSQYLDHDQNQFHFYRKSNPPYAYEVTERALRSNMHMDHRSVDLRGCFWDHTIAKSDVNKKARTSNQRLVIV